MRPGCGREVVAPADGLVLDLAVQPREEETLAAYLVLRFADAAAAWGLLSDPGYRPVTEIRFSITSRGQAVVVPEFTAAG